MIQNGTLSLYLYKKISHLIVQTAKSVTMTSVQSPHEFKKAHPKSGQTNKAMIDGDF
jgi:hypothetical protein